MSIELKNVSKSFGGVRALDNVSLTLEEGRIYGLLGNNGAGKTTLLNIITNRLYADSGRFS
jgi:ABC-2 type transport system ATP-binding protein